jgi:hypothetical protein
MRLAMEIGASKFLEVSSTAFQNIPNFFDLLNQEDDDDTTADLEADSCVIWSRVVSSSSNCSTLPTSSITEPESNEQTNYSEGKKNIMNSLGSSQVLDVSMELQSDEDNDSDIDQKSQQVYEMITNVETENADLVSKLVPLSSEITITAISSNPKIPITEQQKGNEKNSNENYIMAKEISKNSDRKMKSESDGCKCTIL